MGVIISRFRRKKTTTEILEKLETNIKSIERDGQTKEQAHKRIIGYMMAYSVGLYVLFALLYYFKYSGRSQHWLHSLLYASPLLVLPILVIFLRSGISWYYNWSLNKNRIKLNKMKEEKKKILEEVMNTETYKVAKEILDKYGNPDDRALKPFVPSTNVPGNTNITNTNNTPPATPGMLRQRQIMATSTPNNANMNLVPMNTPGIGKGARLRSEQLPRPLLDRNRSALDKVVDYLLKDGPNHRMALICSECSAHNGMALMEEFEYVSYHCAYCGKFHPARKQRPAAPALLSPARAIMPNNKRVSIAKCMKLSFEPPLPLPLGPGSGDDSSVASSSDSEDDTKKNCSNAPGSEGDADRSPSPVERKPKSEMEKKED